MKDRMLLLMAGAIVAGMAAAVLRLEGDHTTAVSMIFAAIGIIACCKRRGGK
ncbi:hypothetical protein [Noviherbaspirillum aerium]|uniref:hypothetical protein n=1 Tax=Noviherbaspirillum aerium TaxID=2588497 RepID=UPI00178C6DFF|nr:hypothetical protein [Noviherbaspirillum aerium]